MFDFIFTVSWVFPLLEVIHVLGFSLWVGSIFILDLKLLGLIKRAPIYHYHLVPWAYIGFALVVGSGTLFVLGNPDYLANPALRLKLLLILAAACLAMFFHGRIVSSHLETANGAPLPPTAKIAGATSLALWAGVLILARMIPYQLY